MKSYYMWIFTVMIFFNACLKEEKMDTVITIKINLPEQFEDINKEEISIRLYNTSGLSYTSNCDASGSATFRIEYGMYEAISQYKVKAAGEMNILNGRIENMIISPTTLSEQSEFTLDFLYATLQQIVIKEIYYNGCKREASNYFLDQYVSLYNNSDEVAYLDNICLGVVNPTGSTSESKFTKEDGTLMDEIPILFMSWAIPGNGEDYPLYPGESVVIAVNAINHLNVTPNSIDLSKADFAFWADNFSTTISPGVEPLIKFHHSAAQSMRTYTLGNNSPAFIIFNIPKEVASSPQEYGEMENNWIQQPGSGPNGTKFMKVYAEWIIDGVECVASESGSYKRLPTIVDAGYQYLTINSQGYSLHRKIEEITEDGRIIYQDTNNSSEDFEMVMNTMKSR